MRRVVVLIVLLPVLAYIGDYLRVLRASPRFGAVRTRRYYAVVLKNHKTEYMYDEPRSQSCVRSVFPHFGMTPCWYLSRHPEQRIEVNSGQPPARVF